VAVTPAEDSDSQEYDEEEESEEEPTFKEDMAKQFSQISQKKSAPAATKKEIKLQKEALIASKNTSSQPPE
jgi:hypothetical protein